MSAETQATCPQCGAALSSQSPGGLCPRCLMAMNLATHTDFGGEKTAPDASATTARTMPSPESLAALFPQLEITECLGRGGMGVVYKARQPRLNRWVALKLLAPERGNDPAFAERFEKEAQALARLNHPNIVTVHDFGEANGSYFLLMEFVDGVTLRQLLDAGRVAPREALAIVPQICDALQFAHDHGIVHRDVKPENILMDRRGRVKVADFGLAKIVGTERGSVSRRNDTTTDASEKSGDFLPGHTAAGHSPALLTDAGKVMGTPHYMAPEQVARPAEVDHRADIYALGVVFYQMLTGELPGKRIEPPSQKTPLDARLDEVVLRALEQNPAQRYQQASVLKTHVETLANGAAPPQITAAPRLSRWQFIALTTFHVIAATLLLLVGWGAFEMGIFFNVLVFFILLMVLVRGVTILWHLFHGTLETGFWRRPFARELRRHRWQLANHWIFWLLAGVVLEHCVVPAQFSTGEYTVIHTLIWGGIVTLLLLNLLPGKRVPVATNLAFALGSIFMATQLTRIHWPRNASDGVVLVPPFRGEWLVINGGPSKLINIHYGTRNQSLALDLDRLAEGRVRPGNRLDVASYPAWGETVFAPANGRITKVISNRIDNAIGQDDSGHPAGNYVVIDLGNDRFVMMAHLQQDSIVVAEGDTVKIGDPIARVGNSGNTTGPHLHLQVQNHPDFRLVTETYPILFRDAERIRSASSRTTEPFFVRRNDRISAMINTNQPREFP